MAPRQRTDYPAAPFSLDDCVETHGPSSRSSPRKNLSLSRANGMLVDFNAAGRPIGIEITTPAQASLALVNAVLKELGQPLLRPGELAPLVAA